MTVSHVSPSHPGTPAHAPSSRLSFATANRFAALAPEQGSSGPAAPQGPRRKEDKCLNKEVKPLKEMADLESAVASGTAQQSIAWKRVKAEADKRQRHLAAITFDADAIAKR